MASFNRQIQNMEVQNNVARLNDVLSATVGSIAGGVAGSELGGALGAAAGLGLTAAAGAADYQINEQLRNENMDYTKDMFGYQLGNIKAVPDGLSKTTAYTKNNKYFPFLEFYTCTDEEKNALQNKLKYNGMTVMAIGKLRGYIGNNWEYNGIKSKGYIKGSIIRIENISEDTHYFNAIADEIFKGVYYDTRRN